MRFYPNQTKTNVYFQKCPTYAFLLQSSLHYLGVSPFNIQIKSFLFLYITILTVTVIKFQQYTAHHSYTHNFSQTYFSQLIYLLSLSATTSNYHFRYQIPRIKSPSWLDLSHPIMSYMSYVIPLFRNFYHVIKCECYCVNNTRSTYIVT